MHGGASGEKTPQHCDAELPADYPAEPKEHGEGTRATAKVAWIHEIRSESGAPSETGK
jgi:hypothetical protein